MRGPLTHLYLFLQDASKADNSGKALWNLVCHKIDQIHSEYHTLLTHMDAIIAEALSLSGCDSLSADTIQSLKLMAWKLVLQQWSSLQRRILAPLKQQRSVV